MSKAPQRPCWKLPTYSSQPTARSLALLGPATARASGSEDVHGDSQWDVSLWGRHSRPAGHCLAESCQKTTPPRVPGSGASRGPGDCGRGRGRGRQSWPVGRSCRSLVLQPGREGCLPDAAGGDAPWEVMAIWREVGDGGQHDWEPWSRKSPLRLSLPSCGATRSRSGGSPRKSRDISQNSKIWGLQVHRAWGGMGKEEGMAAEAGVEEMGRGCLWLCSWVLLTQWLFTQWL